MPGIRYEPVPHDHKAFLEKAMKREGFREAYDVLEGEYALAKQAMEQKDVQPVALRGKRKRVRQSS